MNQLMRKAAACILAASLAMSGVSFGATATGKSEVAVP